MVNNIQNKHNIPELQSPFEQLREVDANDKEWWNSRKLARVMVCASPFCSLPC